MDFSRLINFHREKRAWATLAVHPNSHPFDSALIISNGEKKVTRWLNKEDPRTYYKNQVNAGIHVLSKKLLNAVCPAAEKIDLDREILKPLITAGKDSAGSAVEIYAYSTPEYIKDMGTPERYAQVTLDIENGLVRRRNLSNTQRAVFLDRDGTINKLKGFIKRAEDFELIDGAAEAVGRINRAGYLAIVVTNQPVIARGEAALEELETIHNKMETELGKAGSFVDDIFFCPHHPDRGFPGERLEYKIDCDCRKPKPGLLFRAAKKYNIDISQSFMAGDDIKDVKAALAAGCTPVLLAEKNQMGADVIDTYQGLVCPDLETFTRTYISP
jgi:D,D-heptose 1,7-bisphosphate phosphatase